MKYLALGLASILAFGSLSAVTRADDAASLLQKHKAFASWQFGDEQTRYMQMTETTDYGNGRTVISHIKRIGALYRIDDHDTRSGNDSSSGFTGNIFWYSDQNGFTVPVLGNPAKFSLAEDLFFTDAWTALPWQSRGTENRWDKTYHVFRVQQPNALSADLYVDPATGAYGGVTIDRDGDHERTIHVVDYTSIAGKQFIAHWQWDGSKSIHNVSDITLNAFADSDLHPPAQTAQWEFKDPMPFPIRLTKDRIVIKAKINGVLGTFLLDSGAASIFLSGEFARRAGLKASGHSRAYTLYGVEKTDVGRADTIEFGGNVLRNVNVYYGQPEVDDDGPDGLIGFDFLAGAFVTVDLEKSTMQVQDPNTVDMKTIQGVPFGIDLSSGQPVVPMDVQGKTVVVNAMLDTGAPREILISGHLVTKYGLHMTSVGVLGGCGDLDNMALGPIVYDHPNACTVGGWQLHDALLGWDFLKGFHKLNFNYSHAMMVLEPRKQ